MLGAVLGDELAFHSFLNNLSPLSSLLSNGLLSWPDVCLIIFNCVYLTIYAEYCNYSARAHHQAAADNFGKWWIFDPWGDF